MEIDDRKFKDGCTIQQPESNRLLRGVAMKWVVLLVHVVMWCRQCGGVTQQHTIYCMHMNAALQPQTPQPQLVAWVWLLLAAAHGY
jgi:hypothetical protein